MSNEKYVQLDGAWHQIGDDEHTLTGLVVPPLTPWVRELPEGATLAEAEAQPEPAPEKVAKPKKAKSKK